MNKVVKACNERAELVEAIRIYIAVWDKGLPTTNAVKRLRDVLAKAQEPSVQDTGITQCSNCGRVYRVFLPCPLCFPRFYSDNGLPSLIRLADLTETQPVTKRGAAPPNG